MDEDEIADKFVRIKATKLQILFDPFISKFSWILKGMTANCKRRADIQSKAKQRLGDEFNVVKVIKRVRLANDLWKNVISKDQQKLMKFQKTGVVDLNASDMTEDSSVGPSNEDVNT